MDRDKKGRFVRGTNGDTFEGFGKWYDKKGYPSIWIAGKSVQLHVFIWERENGERPKGYHVHHIDGDKGNFNIKNLVCISPSDHQRIHAGWLKNDKGDWHTKPCKDCKVNLPLNDFYPRKNLTPSNRCKKCSAEYSKNRLINDKEYRERKRIYLKEYYKKKQRTNSKKAKR